MYCNVEGCETPSPPGFGRTCSYHANAPCSQRRRDAGMPVREVKDPKDPKVKKERIENLGNSKMMGTREGRESD